MIPLESRVQMQGLARNITSSVKNFHFKFLYQVFSLEVKFLNSALVFLISHTKFELINFVFSN